MLIVSRLFLAVCAATAISALPRPSSKVYDVQGHRGGRGDTVENTIASFARGLINGVTTLELDNGITKDHHVVVWHDENIDPTKCQDTKPAFPNDPDFPYVGKFIANLTLAQIKTLDCGSERLLAFPLQWTVPRMKLSTLSEIFSFARCVDPKRQILWNIESKVDAPMPNNTLPPEDFVRLQHQEFINSGYPLESITYQSFDWRTLIGMKKLEPRIATSALIDLASAFGPNNSISTWQAGLDISSFPGDTLGVKIANAAASIKADILSPADVSGASPVPDPSQPGYIPFTTKDMIDRAHQLGIGVKVWTTDRGNTAEQLLSWGADGIISDYPRNIRTIVQQKGFTVAPGFPEDRVMKCLKEHIQLTSSH